MDLGYARVSTAKQDLDRQIHALGTAGIPAERIYVDRRPGVNADRPGLRAALAYARAGDVLVVHTLDRLGRTVRDTLNLIHELAEREVGVRTLADPIRVDSAAREDPMAQLAVVLLALFAQMERTYALERAAHARAVAATRGRRVGRPSVVDPDRLDYARHLRDAGVPIAQVVAKTGISRTTLYRYLPPRPPEPPPPQPVPVLMPAEPGNAQVVAARSGRIVLAVRGDAEGRGHSVHHEHGLITLNPEQSRALYVSALGLPLQAAEGDDYLHSEDIEGAKHFGVWPLQQAAQACFGTDQWPADRPVPQASVEFEVIDPEAVEQAGAELEARGFTLLHPARTEPWGQTVARLAVRRGRHRCISYAPSLHQRR